MPVRLGDLVEIRKTPEVDPHLWEHQGRVVALDDHDHLIVELDTGEDCALLPDQVVPKPPGDGVLGPFDIFPGPRRGGP